MGMGRAMRGSGWLGGPRVASEPRDVTAGAGASRQVGALRTTYHMIMTFPI